MHKTWPNSMWACAILVLAGEPFMSAAVAAAPEWLPGSTANNLRQALFACIKLQMADERFASQLLQRSKQLLSQKPRSGSRLAQADADSTAGMCTFAVARLDMQQLSGAAKDLVSISGVAKQPRTHHSNLERLWVFHDWLLQHQLLDG